MKGIKTITAIIAAIVAVGTTTTILHAADDLSKRQPKDIEDVMKWAHKGKDSIAAHVRDGNGTPDEINTLIRFYKFMAKQKAPRGDAADWKEKTEALLKATEDLKKNEPGAVEAYKKAVNCKACHDAHKPKDE